MNALLLLDGNAGKDILALHFRVAQKKADAS